MTTKKRKHIETETLAEFSAQVDAHYEQEIGFAGLVTDLAVVRADLARLGERRKEIKDAIDQRFHRGNFVVDTPGGGVYLYETTKTMPVRHVAPSAVVKKASVAAWEAARIWKPFVRAVAPEAVSLPLGVYRLPPRPTLAVSLATLLDAHGAPVFEAIKELRDRERTTVDELQKLRERTDWDGTEINFADGWSIGLQRLEYDSDQLRKIAPELWEKLAVDTGGASYKQVRTMDLSLAMERGYCDRGDFDSFAD